ncbi:hypothetical protein Tco_0646231 [Tanacetum coccineum]
MIDDDDDDDDNVQTSRASTPSPTTYLNSLDPSIQKTTKCSASTNVDLIDDEDPTDEDGDIGVSVSLGDEISLEGKKSRDSNISDSDNTRDGGKTAGRAIIT